MLTELGSAVKLTFHGSPNDPCKYSLAFQQTRKVHPMLVQCWASVVDGGPTLNRHWVNVSSSLASNASRSLRASQQTRDVVTDVVSMLDKRHRRWSNIETTLSHCVMSTGLGARNDTGHTVHQLIS